MTEFGLTAAEENIIAEIFKHFPAIDEAIIFGSRATNTFTTISDIDFALKGDNLLAHLGSIQAAFEESSLIYEVDVVDYKSIDTPAFKERIDKFGKTFYRKGWVRTTLEEIASINPRESITKGKIAKAVAMNKLAIFNKEIQGYELKPFKGGNKFRNGDTLMARITPCLENGKTAFVDILDDEEIAFGSTEYIVLRARKGLSDKHFLYYLAISPRFREIAIKFMTGTSGRQRVQTTMLVTKRMLLPEIAHQKAIAGILTKLDDKIALLRAQNKTLETLAQTIFKEWFVNFNYPGATDEMIDSELGKIPKGWRVGRLEELGRIVCGKTPSKANKYFFDGEIPFIKIPDMHNRVFVIKSADSLSKSGQMSQPSKTIPANSICVSCIATVGLVSISTSESQTNQQINSIIPNATYLREYLFFTLQMKKKHLIDIGSGGTATLNVNTHVFSTMKILIPNTNLLTDFSKLMFSTFEKVLKNEFQAYSLALTRDSLLPSLMKGEIVIGGH